MAHGKCSALKVLFYKSACLTRFSSFECTRFVTLSTCAVTPLLARGRYEVLVHVA